MNLDFFSNFPNESKVWLYSSNREFNDDEISNINEELKEYTEQWFSHGKVLHASAKLITPFLICFVLDSSKVHASGCSIDDSVKFLKYLGDKYRCSFFDRLKVWVKLDDKYSLLNFSELNDNSDAEIFNLQAKTFAEIKENALIKINEYLKLFKYV